MSVNPYAIPEARLDPNPMTAHGCYRLGRDVLYVTRNSELPHRCVKCNAPARPAKLRAFYWHSPLFYLLILIGLLVYVIVALIARKKVEVSPALCEVHARKRTNDMWLALGVFLAGIAGTFVAAEFDSGWAAFFMFFGGLVACIVLAYRARIMYPVKIDDRGAHFKGCGPAFLASLESTRL